MAKTEVYQIRLDSEEKKQAFAVFKQLGLTPAQAVRMFFRQVVMTQSIPFSIENKMTFAPIPAREEVQDENHQDLFLELDQILNQKQNSQ
ncbi:type II toxin-antitoxin system RelB/DinJ family antitoxin [Acinetobacter qingfengensis]|uniref:RelB/DinJ family addiction module antitoxin n=1 Tax=Acinetobacter qingfengensis TaxID=1262585 RepID=A0A1E7R930_9GAMM|nr:type II toxin-antitoxin system RelB/DinJ family antitoxin [Acinetobacter qingfengensis]KAA8735481.1 type II toxin-antitoxin system RelB/DinJ family antitoxin [Acinetobacter qingfengensis]OEY95874.1 RelB/DinJ family addiction module antitoxin [Acinetobacter qingfengensis]